jgi:putative salt-induced outer membrane protein
MKELSMKSKLIATTLLLALPLVALAEDGEWSGSGEVGLAAARGNSKSETVNAKLQFKKEDDRWKDNFYLAAQRNKGQVSTFAIVDGQAAVLQSYNTTANRYELGASAGYKLNERSYIVGALRYENDDFSPFQSQSIVSIGYGYTLIKNPDTELSVEFGPGYKRVDPISYTTFIGNPPTIVVVDPDSESEIVGRGLVHYQHKFTESTSFEDTLLFEGGSNNKFLQNDAGISVKMNSTLALKIGYQVRHNSEVAPGTKKTDQLLVSNLVYSF